MRTLILLAMDEIAKEPQLFLDLDKAGISRKTQPGQLGFSWDESEHPREPAGSAKGGEFAKKDLGNPVEDGPTYRSKFTGLEFKVTHKKDPEGEGTLPVYTGTVTKQGTGGFAKFKVGDQHSASAIQLVNHYDRIDGEPLNKPEEKSEDPNVLHTFTNEEEGVKSVVARNTGAGGGFIVSLHDTDAGDSVGISSMHTSEEEAIKDAKKLVRHKAEPNVLHTFVHEGDELKAVVARHTGTSGGFAVTFQDSETGKPLRANNVYQDEAVAIRAAKQFVGEKSEDARDFTSLTADELKTIYRDANAWQYLRMRYDYSEPFANTSEHMAFAKGSTKHRLDDWLVARHNITEGTAHRIANDLDSGKTWAVMNGYGNINPVAWQGGDPVPTQEEYPDAVPEARDQKDAEDTGGGSLSDNSPSSLPERFTQATPAWQMGSGAYLSVHNVHQPWIAEISPMQVGMMSERQKAKYQEKRAQEWGTAAKAKEEWHQAVVAAHDRGEFTTSTAGVHPEAKTAILHEGIRREKAAVENAADTLRQSNQITSPDQVNVGDRVYNLMRNQYGTVTAKKRGRLFVQPEGSTGFLSQPFTGMAREFSWKNYNDLQAAAKEQATKKSLLVVIQPEPRLMLELEKARRPTVPSGQMGFSFDEEAHPREAAGSAKGGEFKKKEEPAGEKHYRVMVEDVEGRRGGSRGAKRPYVPYTTPDIKLARELRDDARKWHPAKHGYKVHLEEVPPGEEQPYKVPQVKEAPTPAQEPEPVEPVAEQKLGEQTKEEALRAVQTPKGGFSRSIELLRQLSLHRKAVEDRVRHGEPVPPQVVAQYPHLFVWLSHDELREALKYVPKEEADAYTEDNPERGLSKALDRDPMLLLKAKPQPGQLGFGFDEAQHPREPSGSSKGGEFAKKPEPEYKGGALPKTTDPDYKANGELRKPVILGVNDDVTVCEKCGKPNLKKTVVLDYGIGEPVHYGSDCAAAALYGSKSGKNRAKVDLEAQAVEYALRRMKETGDPDKVAGEIQGRIGYGRTGMRQGGLDVGDIHIREDGSIGEPVGPIMTADLLTRIQNMLRSGKYSHDQIADMRGATVSQVRSIARSLPKHEPLGGHMPSHVPVGSSSPVTDTPGPTEEFRLSKGGRLLVSLEPAAETPIAIP